ncbi:LPD23 domain-containing protein [uncultured Flavonifractor sp.]|uniref:LPD23 domain-containing protein n=1 Tax=uncultured Flavonifractor sp. TaxID=1193534 RepID=UPI00261EED62|nr:LPD23 domain-containing protein [uncultured Flavonifractor sp.]
MGNKSGSGKRFKTSVLEAIQPKKRPAISFASVDRAQADLQSWESELTGLYTKLETAWKDAEAKAQELERIYTRLQAYQADSRFGSDALIRGAYDNLARQYNELLPSYLETATAHDSMAQEYNTLLERYQSGYTAYRNLLYGQGKQAAELLRQAEQAEQEAREAQTVLNGVNRYGTADQKEEWQAKLDEAESRAAKLREQAELAQAYYYAAIPMMDDYEQLSKAAEAKRKADVPNLWKFWEDNGDDLYDFINNLPAEDGSGYRDYVAVMSMGTGQGGKYGDYTAYSYMTEDEIGVYNYLYDTAGREAAEAYLEEIRNSLNYRQGEEDYENLSGVGKALYWIPAGVDRFASGVGQLLSEKALHTSPMQYTNQMIAQEAKDIHPALGMAYDLGTTVSNMAPSILLGALTGGILSGAGVAAGTAATAGSAVTAGSVGLSAGGNAYTQKVNEGYTPEQARSYATLVGISEGALQYLLGGISSAGGVGAEQVLGKLAPKIAAIDNALARTIVNGGVRLAVRGTAEGFEESLQAMLEPAFATLILDEEYNWGENFENAAYSFLMGFMAAGVFEGVSMAAGGAGSGAGGFDANMDGYIGQASTDYFAGCNTAEEVETRYRELAREHHPDLGGDTSTMADINRQHDMRKAWFIGQQQAKSGAQTKERDVQPLSLPSLSEETDTAQAADPGTPPAPDIQAVQIAPETPGANYARALQRAGADVNTAQTVGYLLHRAEQGMTLTEDQRTYIASVPGGAELMGRVQPAAQWLQEGRQMAGENLPDREAVVGTDAAQGATEAGFRADTTIGGRNDGRQEQLAQQRPGDGVPDGGQGRISDPGAGKQTGGLGAGAARSVSPSEQGRTAISRQNRGKYLRAERVSSQDLGLTNGTETPSVSVVREADWDEGLRSTAERVYQETGLPVTYVLGRIQVRDSGGAVRTVRGVYSPDRIILQADNLRVTTDQIADHEIFHDKAFRTPGLVRELEARIVERYSREEFDKVVGTYVEKLRGVVDLSENATPDEINAAMQIIKEEIFADAYAGINAFAAHAERFQDGVNQVLDERGLGRGNAAATERTTGPPAGQERFSYGGRYANQADSESRAEAERLEMQGVDPETIRQETGWFRGADDLWRFEIDDSGMEYLHEVLAEDNGAAPFKTGAQSELGKSGGDTPSVVSILRKIRDVKHSAGRTGPANPADRTRYSVDEDNQDRERMEIDSHSPGGYDETTETALTVDEEAAVLDYKSSGSYQINAALRDGYPMDQSQYRTVEALDTALEKLPVYQGLVYRRLGFDSIGGQEAMDDFLAEHRAGEVLQYPAYTSSSNDPEGYLVEGELVVTMIIESQSGRNLDGYGNNFESEILFPRNSAFRVERVKIDGQGKYVIFMREVLRNGIGQLYSQEQYGGVQPVPEVQQGDNHLRKVPGMDPWTETRGTLQGLRAGRAEGEGARGMEAGSQENDGRNGRAQQQVGEGERLNGSDVRFSVDDEGNGQSEQQNGEQEQKTRRRRTTRPVAESRPILAKKGLRQNLLGLFSIPDGMRAELGSVIDQYADRMLKAGSLTEQDRTALFDRMYSSGVVTLPADDYFQTGREAVKGGRIYVAPRDQHEFGDGWNDFRKRAFAAGIYITSNPMDQGIGQWNTELADMLPGLFDAAELDSRAILERIVQVAEEGKDEKVSLAEYTAQLAEEEYVSEDQVLDDMERKMDWALRTFAEKASLEIHLRDRTGVKIAQEREKFSQSAQRQREKEMLRRAEERDRRRAQIQRQRENRELRELQQRTLKQLQWLSKNRFRAPAELKDAWDQVLGDIDIYAAGAANEMNWSKRYGATWRDLVQMYEDFKEDPNFLESAELEKIRVRLKGSKIADMDISALQNLYQMAVGLRTVFYNRNNVINDELGRMFAEVYTDAKQEIETAPGGYTGGAVDRLFNLEQLTPMNVLERMGGWNPDGAFYSMAKQLEKGERDVRAYTVEANRYLEDFLTEHADWVKRADGQGKDAIWYELEVPELLELGMGDKPIFGETKKVYMTPSQKVHLYLESKNTDNLWHMTGGRSFVNRELYSQGKRQEALAQGTTISLAPETVKKIVSDLTEEEMELARLLENYYNDFAKRKINAVSNSLYGYDKAISRNYAPIFTDDSYNGTEFGVFDSNAENVPHMKGRIKRSKNPTYNLSAFDAFERHVDQTSRFVGLAIPTRNWQRLLSQGDRDTTMKQVISKKWGKEGLDYIADRKNGVISRLQHGVGPERDTVSTAADRLLSRYISAIFGANPSIVTKQFGSIFMAMPELGVRNIPTPAQLRSIDKDLIAKYTSELAWRGMGYATPETKQLKENPNWIQTNKFTRFTFGGGAIIAADQTAASILWPWAENKVRREFPDLEVGTQEQIDAGQSPFYRKVAEEFNNAVNRSQSVSDEVHQGKLRKSRNPITRALTMFKSDSAQGYNQLRQRIGEAKYYERSGADAETVRKAKRAVGAAVLGILTNNLWATAITFLIALWKNKGKYYRDDEEKLTVESVGIEMASTLFSSLAGLVAGGEELADVIGNIITGDTWYGIDAPGMEQVADLGEKIILVGTDGKELLNGAVDILNHDGNLMEYLRQSSRDIIGIAKDTAQTVATYFGGIPVNNVEAYLLGLVKWVSPEVVTAYESAFSSAQKSDLTELTGDALAVQTGSLLDLRVGDTEQGTAEALAALYEQGYKKAVPSDVPSSVSVDGTDHELSPYQQQVYRDVWKGIVAGALDELASSDMFRDADAEMQEKMLERLYEYGASQAKTTLFEDYETESWVEGAGEAKQAGISTAEWAAYYTMVSEIKKDKSMTSYQRGEAGRDLIRAADMTDQQKLTLYGAVYGSDADSRTEKFRAIMDTGLTFARTMDVYGKYAELEEDEEASAADQATDFHLWLGDQGFSTEQMGVIEEELKFWSMMPGQANSKVVMANDYGIEPETYDALKAAIAEIDTNGSTSQDEATAAINTLPGLTTRERAILWQLQNKGWKAKNNPFSVSVGQEVYDAMNADEKQESLQLPGIGSQRDNELPRLSLPSLD